ncbi:hypothetical protein DFP93_1071 [Aneurinibacillus soli]|uniref:Uncharacterized protein n=1 Tax=Aneurinibacillus soli TaxID=1500254 RepID=A0A0U5B1R6_9BACL|nr:hypothetical protein [Aneurinibacillus soli]PYE61612.1 hypothetical protein DFP93_1071 [Aneurinibacillus soli]BAU28530.1 hypothetical protein CB4_02704 [Aneurinibacillus soli]
MSKQRKKQRGCKIRYYLTQSGYDKVVREREMILKEKLPAVRESLKNASEALEQAKLMCKKDFLLRCVLVLGQMLNYSKIIPYHNVAELYPCPGDVRDGRCTSPYNALSLNKTGERENTEVI